jgi:TrmH family RNA methyltransferase
VAPSHLAKNLSDSITVILHRPAIPENIGSVARAMANTGFTRLIISSPDTRDWATAERLAVSASPILQQAPRCRSIEEAVTLSGARHLIGTTGRNRKYWQSAEISTAAPQIILRSLSGGAALLFGPENTGLTNEELTLCHMAVHIPAKGELACYNLAQAVLLVLFTLMVQSLPVSRAEGAQYAPFETLEGMYGHIQELLLEVGFLWKDNPDHMMREVRGFLNRRRPGEDEVRMIRGICRKLLYHLRSPRGGERKRK